MTREQLAEIYAREQYLKRLREIDVYLREHPGAYDVRGVRVLLVNLIRKECYGN